MAKTTREAANRARAGEGPTFIDAPRRTATKGTRSATRANIATKKSSKRQSAMTRSCFYQNILKERGWIDQEAIDRMLENVKEEVEESIEFAEQCDPPAMDALYEDITVAHFIPQE